MTAMPWFNEHDTGCAASSSRAGQVRLSNSWSDVAPGDRSARVFADRTREKEGVDNQQQADTARHGVARAVESWCA